MGGCMGLLEHIKKKEENNVNVMIIEERGMTQ